MRRLRSRGPRRALALLALAALTLAAAALALSGCHPIAAVKKRWEARSRPAYRRLSPPVAYAVATDNPSILILDLRRPDEFQGSKGHLPHAWNVPLERLPYRMLELAPYREETFLVYCRRGDSCGEDGMRVLVASGFEDGMLIEGGIERWIKLGYKTVITLAGAPRPAGPPQPQEPSSPP
jgi:phage shock protein E